MHQVIIELDNVWKIYKIGEQRIEALRGINLKIYQNELVAIMGPSGSGKSTLLYSVGALDIPTKGAIYLKGKNISHMSESTLAQVRGQTIGFVFQSFNLIPSLTALENVMLPMTFQGKNRDERKRRATELLKVVGLSERMYNRPNQLSGGQQQRVAIARALGNDPEVILADEPTGNLDSTTGKAIMEMLENLHKDYGKTLILVTHDPNIAKYAKRKVGILDGKIKHDGSLEKEVLWKK